MKLSTLSENIITIDDFLTKAECSDFISLAEANGFRSADVDMGDKRAHLTLIRNNDRVDIVSEELALEWWDMLPVDQLPLIEGRKAIGLSPRFRFYRYTPGQKFNMHKDGRQDVGKHKTLMSFLVYLNEGYKGGSTKFKQDDVEVTAVIGKGLIFEHRLWHQGTILEEGSKYLLRTDIVFED